MIAVAYAIRAAFCQSLGISPLVGLQDLSLPQPLQTSLGGQTEAVVPSPIDIINLVRHVLQESKEIHNVDDVNLQKLLQYNII